MEQAIVNLSKVMGDFVGEQKAINFQLHQKIENVESAILIHAQLGLSIKNIYKSYDLILA